MPEVAANRVILLVDDNPDDVVLIRRAFERAGLRHWVMSVPNAIEAIAYLSGDAPYRDRLISRSPT